MCGGVYQSPETMMAGIAKLTIWSAILLMAGCAHPPRIETGLSFRAGGPGQTIITLRIRNLEDRATTPLRVDVSVQERTPAGWQNPVSVLHPSAFVLNRHEQQVLHASVPTTDEALHAILTVKEQETGALLVSKVFERPGVGR